MCRLHRLPHHPDQVVVQRGQVCLVAQLGGEGFEGLSRVVLAAIERLSMNDWIRRLKGEVNRPGRSILTIVEAPGLFVWYRERAHVKGWWHPLLPTLPNVGSLFKFMANQL